MDPKVTWLHGHHLGIDDKSNLVNVSTFQSLNVCIQSPEINGCILKPIKLDGVKNTGSGSGSGSGSLFVSFSYGPSSKSQMPVGPHTAIFSTKPGSKPSRNGWSNGRLASSDSQHPATGKMRLNSGYIWQVSSFWVLKKLQGNLHVWRLSFSVLQSIHLTIMVNKHGSGKSMKITHLHLENHPFTSIYPSSYHLEMMIFNIHVCLPNTISYPGLLPILFLAIGWPCGVQPPRGWTLTGSVSKDRCVTNTPFGTVGVRRQGSPILFGRYITAGKKNYEWYDWTNILNDSEWYLLNVYTCIGWSHQFRWIASGISRHGPELP